MRLFEYVTKKLTAARMRERNRERSNLHGWEMVTGESARHMFAELIGSKLASRGFSFVTPMLLGRQVSSDVIHLMKLNLMKGHVYYPMWGVSLSFVPHEFEKGLKWHRTLKSARMDLFEIGVDIDTEETGLLHDIEVDTFHGNPAFREDLIRVWSEMGPHILRWYASAEQLEDILAKAKYQAQMKTVSARRIPSPAFVGACIMARLGRQEVAQGYLKSHASKYDRGSRLELMASALRSVPLGMVRSCMELRS